MEKRSIIFGDYDTAAHGDWTLAPGWKLSDPEQKTNYVDKTGGNGTWDLSTAMTDGIPVYNDRTLTATFESSEGDRLSRRAVIREMTNRLDGLVMDIQLPDDPFYHLVGRVHVAEDYNDLAHAAVTVTAICEPWLYANAETSVHLTAAADAQTARIINRGRRVVVPTLTVTGSSANVLLVYGAQSVALSAGVHQWPDLLLTPGGHDLTYSGTGALVISYREAVLK